MRLIDLPITLREAAVKNQIAQGNERDVYALLRFKTKSFSWHSSTQGSDFWIDASEGLFSKTLKYRL